MMDDAELMALAAAARDAAYAPYSEYSAGAALLCEDGSVYTGSNIENAAFTPTVCAERVAFFKAVSEGKRAFKAVAVAGGKAGKYPDGLVAPCGVCRQVMAEFCDAGSFEIIFRDKDGSLKVVKLGDILPFGFGPGNLR